VQAQERYVEDIQVSRTDSVARIVVELACPMRFLADNAGDAGIIVEVRIAPFESCRQLGLGAGIASEAYRPIGGQLANLSEVEYESLGLGDSFLFFRFDKAVSYSVSQEADLRQVVLSVNLDEAPVLAASAPPIAPAASTSSAARNTPSVDRVPANVTARAPSTTADYVINLQSTREPMERATIDAIETPTARKLYISETSLNGQTWYRLRIGFFESETQARNALETLRAAFPRAWIGRADSAEVELASSEEFAAGGVVAATVTAAALPTVAATPRGVGSAQMTPEEVADLMGEAREALIAQRYEAAANTYTRLLAEPGSHQQEARENLGVAREKLGQLDRASAEYRAYLREYPDDPARARVQQRLEGILTAAAQPRAPLRRALASNEPSWDFVTGISQYYRRDVDTPDGADEDFIGLDALQTDIDFSTRRTGGRLDMLSRVSLSQFHDLIGEDNDGPGDQSRVTYAYLDVIDTERDWLLRVGRQTLHNFGVLGRFDGAHFSYGWRPDQRMHLTMGYPVESTRDAVETDRQFFGLAADFDGIFAGTDLTVFFNNQQSAGIDARRAIGAELHYAQENGNITGIVDYDVDFADLNMVMLLGTWRLSSGTTLSGLLDIRLNPILTTRNALIGQPVTTIDELLLTWTEEEIRQLAADRTAQARTLTIGASQPLGERFQLNVDLTVTEIDDTVASGGVAAIPGTGPQSYLSTNLVGAGLFGKGDVHMLNLRYGTGDNFTTSELSLDARYPIGRRVRLNPRLRFGTREGLQDGATRETMLLGLRLLVNTREHFRFEFEVGANRSTRTEALGTSDTSGYYVDAGYRASF